MKKILYVLHSGTTGGTFLTNKDLMKNVEKHYEIFLLSAENDFFSLFKYSKGNLSMIKQYPRNSKWSAKEFHNSWNTYVYFDILNMLDVDLIHIRHLINHSFDLPQVAKKLDIPVVLSCHDFYFICPFYVLLDENNTYCKGICNDNSKNCYNPLLSLKDINSKEIIPKWRENISKMFEFVDYFVSTSEIVKNIFISTYSTIKPDKFKIIEHGRDFPKLKEDFHDLPSKDNPIKILCPANHLNEMKGSNVIKSIKKEDKDSLLEFHFLGNLHNDIEKFGINHGTFDRDDFYKKVKSINPSFVGIFSIWPETFCHTITEAWSCGIPVIGSNIGVIEDRILKNDGGWVIDINNYKKSYKQILDIAYNKDSYLQVQEKIKHFDFKTTNQMANEYIDIYKSLLSE